MSPLSMHANTSKRMVIIHTGLKSYSTYLISLELNPHKPDLRQNWRCAGNKWKQVLYLILLYDSYSMQ